MGQKANPIIMRLGINKTWESSWFARGNVYRTWIHEDFSIRRYIRRTLRHAGIARVFIERPHKKCVITVHAARPGLVIGRKGGDIEKMKKRIQEIVSCDVFINIVDVKKPELEAILVADSIAQQLEKRISSRRAMKKAVQAALRAGAGGIRVSCSGRLGGAEIARKEEYREGRVPLHTLRADVDYGVAVARTAYGTCGVKVWIFKGEIMMCSSPLVAGSPDDKDKSELLRAK